jgi:hypothetical protein
VYGRDVTDKLDRSLALALRLNQIGADDDLIADCVGVEPEAVPALVNVASRKAADLAREAP